MISFVLFVLGFVFLIKGADFLVDGAASIAKKFNISSIVIGLTIVAFGTSMPELIVNIFHIHLVNVIKQSVKILLLLEVLAQHFKMESSLFQTDLLGKLEIHSIH